MPHTDLRRHERLIGRCLELAEVALAAEELPFGSVIARDDLIVAEGHSAVRATRDVTAHAEVTAMRTAQQTLRTSDLSGYTIYSSFEPCAMCAFIIRELRLSRVVFALASPAMGGYSRWPILQDEGLTRHGSPFAAPPDVVTGILADRAAAIFAQRRNSRRT